MVPPLHLSPVKKSLLQGLGKKVPSLPPSLPFMVGMPGGLCPRVASPKGLYALHWHNGINLQKCRLMGISYKKVFFVKTPRNSI